jgi:hypothetical protein
MTFADKCKLLGKRRGRNRASATASNKLRAALLPGRRREIGTVGSRRFAVAKS